MVKNSVKFTLMMTDLSFLNDNLWRIVFGYAGVRIDYISSIANADTLKILHKYVGIPKEMIERLNYSILVSIINAGNTEAAEFIWSISDPISRTNLEVLSLNLYPSTSNYHSIVWFIDTFKVTDQEFKEWRLLQGAVCWGSVDLIKFYHTKYKITVEMFFVKCLHGIVIWNRMDILEYLYSELKFTKIDIVFYYKIEFCNCICKLVKEKYSGILKWFIMKFNYTLEDLCRMTKYHIDTSREYQYRNRKEEYEKLCMMLLSVTK